jgi:hypothetical protein
LALNKGRHVKNIDDPFWLDRVIHTGDLKGLVAALEAGCPVENPTSFASPLTQVCGSSHASAAAMVAVLLARGADPRAGTESPLRAVASTGNVEVARLLIEAGADPTCLDYLPLRHAASEGHSELAAYLDTESGRPVKFQDDRWTRSIEGHVVFLAQAKENPETTRLKSSWVDVAESAAANNRNGKQKSSDRQLSFDLGSPGDNVIPRPIPRPSSQPVLVTAPSAPIPRPIPRLRDRP